jgi:outer membrane receptor for ferrienterochelin and colicins
MYIRVAVAVAGALAACPTLGLAADASSPAELPAAPTVATTQVYDRAYFSAYDLSNAEDMLRRIPGVAAVLDSSRTSQARGLGAGSEQILIDGKRMASKSDGAAAALRRIPASSVERVELIRGSTDEVQSEGLVVNVVIKPGVALGGVGNFELVYRLSDKGWSDADGLISWSDSRGRLSYVVAFENAAWSPLGLVPNSGPNDWTIRTRDERYFYPSGAVQELRPQRWKREQERNTFTAQTTYDLGGGDTLRANLLYQTLPTKQTDITDLTRFNTTGVATSRATEFRYGKNRTDTFELGGELEKKIGPGTLSVIALHTRASLMLLDFRNRSEATGAYVELGRSGADQSKGEDVVQASYALPLSESQTLTVGAEGARNFLTQEIDVFFDTNRDGRLEEINIPTALARVQEKRAELFATHSWRINSKLSLDSALYFEISRITTNYPDIPIRTLKYLKPRIDLRYNVTPADRLRVTAQRSIGQLDFFAFVPAYNVVDNRIDLGNPELLPMRSHSIEGSYEHRLANDGGTLGARAYFREVNGGPGFEPFGFNSAGLPQSRRGNNPLSKFWGYEVNAALRLTPLGLPGAQVTGRMQKSMGSAIDLFNLRERKGLNPWVYETALGFRHDVTSWRASYGFDYLDVGGDQLVSDVRNWETFTRGERLNAYIEKTLWGSYSIRFDAYNLNGAQEYKHRTLYTISQLDGTISRTETYVEARDRRFSVRLRGKF